MRNLEALGDQLLRMGDGGAPAVEPAAEPLVDANELFAWLVDAARVFRSRVRSAKRNDLLRVTKNGAGSVSLAPASIFMPYFQDRVPLEFDAYLPSAADSGIEEYLRRVEESLGGAEFGFQVPNLQAANWEAFGRLRAVVGPIFDRLGMRIARFNCFIGNYRRTPFGAHVDAHHLHSFQYVVLGDKTLRAWNTADLVREIGEPRMLDLLLRPTSDYDTLPAPRTLVASERDVIYWPAGYTHCLESSAPSAGISIVVESRRPSLNQFVAGEIQTAVLTQSKREGDAAPAMRRASGVVRRSLRGLARQLGRAPLETEILHKYIIGSSGKLFGAVPDLNRPVTIEPDDVLESRLVRRFEIAYHRLDTTVLIAVNGHGAQWPDPKSSKAVLGLLSFLNRADSFQVSEVIERFADARRFTSSDVLDLLQFFVSAGAFEKRKQGARSGAQPGS